MGAHVFELELSRGELFGAQFVFEAMYANSVCHSPLLAVGVNNSFGQRRKKCTQFPTLSLGQQHGNISISRGGEEFEPGHEIVALIQPPISARLLSKRPVRRPSLRVLDV